MTASGWKKRKERRTRAGARVALLGAALLAAVAHPARAERAGPASRLPDARNASEYWDFIARLDSGHLVLSRFSITNEGPGDHTAYMIGHVVLPDGRSIQFEKGRKKGRWSLSDDGLHIEIGGNELHQNGPERALRIDRSGVRIDLRFAPEAPGTTQRDPFGKSYWVDLLHTSSPVQGTLFVPGMETPIEVRGRISGTHTWMGKSEPRLNRRRIEFFGVRDGPAIAGPDRPALYISDFTSPQGARSAWLVLERAGEVVYQTDQLEIELLEDLRADLGRRYPVPARLVITGPGVEGEIRLSRLRASDNPMNIIPQPFRFLLSFKMNPRRAWADSTFEVRLHGRSDEPDLEVSGSGVTAVMYTNPLPRGM